MRKLLQRQLLMYFILPTRQIYAATNPLFKKIPKDNNQKFNNQVT